MNGKYRLASEETWNEPAVAPREEATLKRHLISISWSRSPHAHLRSTAYSGLPDRRQQDVKQPHLRGEVEQGEEMARVRLCPLLPPPHASGTHAEAAGKTPPRQPGSFYESLQPLREVWRESGRFHVIDVPLTAHQVATPSSGIQLSGRRPTGRPDLPAPLSPAPLSPA